MMINNRQEDLSKVFDKTWRANHNNTAELGRKHDREMMDKLYDKKVHPFEKNTPSDSVGLLNKNMNTAFNAEKSAKLNNIMKKWK